MAARRLIPRAAYGARMPLLVLSVVLLVAAVVIFATGHDFGAMTALIGAFLAVAAAKRA
jgi:hypothetical protein